MTKKPAQTRYEIKIVIDESQKDQVSQWIRLHSLGFAPAYPPRRVNNIYFDTFDLDSLNDHVSGISERRKLRLRWYGESYAFQSALLEVKQKLNRLGWKDTQPIHGLFDLQTMTWNEIITLIKESSREGFLQMIEESNPVLINRYRREYYKAAFDDEVRVSVDSKLTTYLQHNNYKPNLQFPQPPEGITILEVKCPLAKSDRIPELLGEFPARPGAFSKYNQAMEYNNFL
jgi:SPX domain protein involved in polyphosphate accumulation